MVTKSVAILSLAGAAFAFAQMDMSSSSMPVFTTPAIDSAYAGSAIAGTYPPMTTTVAVSSMPISFGANSSITPAYNSSSGNITTLVSYSITASRPFVTVTDVSIHPKMNYTRSTPTGGVGSGGRSTPKPSVSATAIGKPAPDDSGVNGISIGLLLVSVALTVLFQI